VNFTREVNLQEETSGQWYYYFEAKDGNYYGNPVFKWPLHEFGYKYHPLPLIGGENRQYLMSTFVNLTFTNEIFEDTKIVFNLTGIGDPDDPPVSTNIVIIDGFDTIYEKEMDHLQARDQSYLNDPEWSFFYGKEGRMYGV
jgi:hypothetical protein